jgi:hypothetical protein
LISKPISKLDIFFNPINLIITGEYMRTLIAIAILLCTSAHAQYIPGINHDSTTIGAMANNGMTNLIPKINESKTTWMSSSLINVPSGTQCGAATQGSVVRDAYWTACLGYNPKYSCPTSFTRAVTAEADNVYLFSCTKD